MSTDLVDKNMRFYTVSLTLSIICILVNPLTLRYDFYSVNEPQYGTYVTFYPKQS
jgi:hypothetical protein